VELKEETVEIGFFSFLSLFIIAVVIFSAFAYAVVTYDEHTTHYMELSRVMIDNTLISRTLMWIDHDNRTISVGNVTIPIHYRESFVVYGNDTIKLGK
jgi:hypothetical protein